MLIEKNFQGALIASDLIPTDSTKTHHVRIHRIYMGYTKKEVKTDFKKYLKTLTLQNR